MTQEEQIKKQQKKIEKLTAKLSLYKSNVTIMALNQHGTSAFDTAWNTLVNEACSFPLREVGGGNGDSFSPDK